MVKTAVKKNNKLRALLDTIGDIYEAAYRPAHWNIALENICGLVNARSASLLIQSHENKRTFLMYGHAIPKMVLFAYNHGLATLDPGWEIMAAEPVGRPRLFTNSDNQNAAPVYVKMIMKPARMHYLAGINIFNDKTWHVGLGIHRDKNAGVFEQPELDLLAELLPHLQRSVLIQREFTQVQLQNRALTEGLSRVTLAMMLLREDGSPTYINPVAESILESHPAIKVTQQGISAYHQDQSRALREGVQRIANCDDQSAKHTTFCIGLKHPSRQLPLTAMLAPYKYSEIGIEALTDDAKVLMYLSDAEPASEFSVDSLSRVYGLSEAESFVAIGIVNGLNLEQIAQANHVSINTVKTQLKSVFRKTNTNRQVDLARLLLNNRLLQVG